MRALVLMLLLFGTPVVLAADPAEISFWESVRDSRDTGELRAYLERYPSGDFAALARQRIAALESAGSRPSPRQPAQEIAWTLPRPGDSWTYRLREPKRANGPKERTLVVTATGASSVEVSDELAIDGAPPVTLTHARGGQLITEGASVFSPYLPLITASGAPPAGSIGRVRITEEACTGGRFICEAKGRMIGKETVRVPAGTFAASKIIVEQSWHSSVARSGGDRGGRTLTVWYAPEVRRVVKYASRTTFGLAAPIDPDFEIELVSFKVQ